MIPTGCAGAAGPFLGVQGWDTHPGYCRCLGQNFPALVSFLHVKGVFVVPEMRLGAALVPLPIAEIPHLTYIQTHILMPAAYL